MLRCVYRAEIFDTCIDLHFLFEKLAIATLCQSTCSNDDHETVSKAIEYLLFIGLDMPYMCERNDIVSQRPSLTISRPDPQSFNSVFSNLSDESCIMYPC